MLSLDWLLAWPHWLWLAPLPLLAWLLPPAQENRAPGLRMPFAAEVVGQGGGRSMTGRVARMLLLLAWLLLVVAAARPQQWGEQEVLPRSGRDLMLAVDLSGSMSIEDMRLAGRAVNRLDALKVIAGDFIRRREGDRLGLILFGRAAYLQTPLTFDIETVRAQLQESEIGLAGRETAIGDAMGLAVKRLRERPAEQRVLILLTDGANTAGALDPRQAAQLAAEAGIRIHTVGLGADEMLVRDLLGSRRVNPSADLDEAAMREIAARTGGRYFRARDTAELAGIYAELDRIEAIENEEHQQRPLKERYPWPLAGALALAMVGVGLRRLQ